MEAKIEIIWNLSRLVLPVGIEPTPAILETTALPFELRKLSDRKPITRSTRFGNSTENTTMNITEIVKNKRAHVVHYREGHFIYETDDGFQFPIPLTDIGNSTLQAEDRAVLFMRWIRQHLEVKSQAATGTV